RTLVQGWPQLAEHVGLKGVRLDSAAVEDHGWILALRLPPRLSLADVVKEMPRLEAALDSMSINGLHVRPGAVRVEPDARRASRVGAGTVRRDDPRLLVRSPDRRGERTRRGLPASPLRVTLTAGGDLDPGARLFTTGDAGRLVYCRTPVAGALRRRLGEVAEV